MTTSTTGVGYDVDTSILRSFNRAWSQRVGVMEESFLGTGRSFGASRLLFEIGTSGAGVLELRRRLALDSGYLSRLLRGLEDEGLVEVRRDPADQRRRLVVPTAAGRRAIDRLEDRSEERAADLVGPLGPSQRRRLSEALATAERLIRAATVVRGSGGRVVDGGRRRRTPLLRRARRALPRRLRPGRRRDDRRSGHGSSARRVPGRQGGRRGGGVRRRPAAHPGDRRDQADVGRRARGAAAGSEPGCSRRSRTRPGGSATARSTSTPTARWSRRSRCTSGPATAAIERYNDNPFARRWFAKRLPRR